jgi:hypothetical protein
VIEDRHPAPVGPLRVLGGLMVVEAVAYVGLFSALGAIFNYPAVLREPVGDVLRRFVDTGPSLVTLWYALMLTALLFLPVGILLPRAVSRDPAGGGVTTLGLTGALGAFAALAQALGLARWVFLVPFLADLYVEPSSSAAMRDAAVVVFEAFHRFLGAGVGEHLGYAFTGAWTVLVATRMARARGFGPFFAVPGVLAGVAILMGMLEPAGVGSAVAINAAGYILWSAWLAAAGIRLLRGIPTADTAAHQAELSPAPAPVASLP